MAGPKSQNVVVPKFDNNGQSITSAPLTRDQVAARALRETRFPAGALQQDKGANALKPADTNPIEKNEKFVNVRTGGMWFDGKLIAIQIFENLYTQDTVPFSYTAFFLYSQPA